MIQAGFARVDITPPLGTKISGYFHERLAEGVRDPLQLNALAYGNGTQSALIIACDVVAITQEYAELIRARIAARTGVPKELVMICALHQHTAICLGGREIFFPVKEPVYLETLYRKFEDVAVMALADMSEARLFTAEGEVAEPIAFIRRYYMPDGSIKTNPSRKGPRPVRPCDEADNTVRLIRFAREDKQDIAYVNFSTHPDVISGCKFSADWPGFVRRFVEGDNADALCISVTGFQGDSNHCNYLDPESRSLVRGSGYEHSRYMGRVIADTVARLWEGGTVHTDDRILGEVRTVYSKTNTAGEELYDEAQCYVADYYAGTPKPTAHISDIATAVRVIDLRTTPLYQPVTVSLLSLGDILFFGLGGEPFTRYARIAREMLPADKTLLCSCCTNGYQGYLPSKQAFDEGGYEISNTFFTPDLEALVVNALRDMIEKI